MREADTTVDAIVVGRLDVGEQDRVFRLLTAESGLVSGWANRARAARSPFAVLDLGVRVSVGVRRRPRSEVGDLVTITGVQVVEPRIGVRGDLDRLGPAALACELAAGLGTTVPDPRLFGCLETALLLLDQHPELPGTGFLAALVAKLLTFAGLAPALERCPGCGAAPERPMAWFAGGGGAFHVEHLPPDAAGAPRIELEALTTLASLRRMPLLDAYAVAGELAPMLALAEWHLGHSLRARVWLQG